jgi:hypothetical protein
MGGELPGDMPRRRGMARQEGQRVEPLLLAGLGIAIAEKDLLARLMRGAAEIESATFPKII